MSRREVNAARLKADPTLAEHGSNSTYLNWGCRCEPCTDAHRIVCADLYEKRVARLSAGEVVVPHGRGSTYTNWGCRCAECRSAWAAAQRARYNRKAAA